MQELVQDSSNAGRSERTKSALKAAARALFVEKGYAETATQEIVKSADVTRGALYHHYKDKRDLFADIVEDECAAVASEIAAKGVAAEDALSALKAGSDAFIEAYAAHGRTRIVLIEAPVVLGRKQLIEIENRHTRQTLVDGLSATMKSGQLKNLPLAPLVELLSAMFDSAAINIDDGADPDGIRLAVHAIIDGLADNK